jgi:hypothetical protein
MVVQAECSRLPQTGYRQTPIFSAMKMWCHNPMGMLADSAVFGDLMGMAVGVPQGRFGVSKSAILSRLVA